MPHEGTMCLRLIPLSICQQPGICSACHALPGTLCWVQQMPSLLYSIGVSGIETPWLKFHQYHVKEVHAAAAALDVAILLTLYKSAIRWCTFACTAEADTLRLNNLAPVMVWCHKPFRPCGCTKKPAVRQSRYACFST